MAELGLPLTGTWLKDHGVGQTTVRNFLAGMSQSLTVETVAKLAEPLKTTERWIIFGGDAPVSEGMLLEMAETAAEEIQAGMRIAEIRNAVAAGIREQLRIHLAVGAAQDSSAAASARGKSAQPGAPTKGAAREELRNA